MLQSNRSDRDARRRTESLRVDRERCAVRELASAEPSPVVKASWIVLFCGLGGDFIDDDGFGAAAVIDLATGGNFFSSEGKKLGVLSAGRGRIGDGPVDCAVFRKDDQLGASLRAS